MIVGITGQKRAGKDTLARAFVHRGFHRYALADPIKQACMAFFDWTPEYIETHKETPDPRWNISPRRAMQIVGTEIFREHLPRYVDKFPDRFWIRRMADEYWRARADGRHMVVPDVRFVDEATAVHDLGGFTIRVDRPGLSSDGHASEAEVSRIIPDWTVVNHGTARDLEQTADNIAAWFCERYLDGGHR